MPHNNIVMDLAETLDGVKAYDFKHDKIMSFLKMEDASRQQIL